MFQMSNFDSIEFQKLVGDNISKFPIGINLQSLETRNQNSWKVSGILSIYIFKQFISKFKKY